MQLQPSDFFDLSHFEHGALFKGASFAWEVLPLIESYLKNLLLGRIEGDVSSRAYLIHPKLIFIGEGTVVEPGAYIQGPCWIGKNCVVRHGAYIRGNLITGNNCVVGHDSEVKNAIFLNEAHAAHFAYVGDSILGNEVNLGAGTKCANFRLDKQPIIIHDGKKKIKTGLRKFGAIIGDKTQIGCNSVTNPGALIGREVRCYPCLNLGGVIPSRSVVKSNVELVVSSY